MNAELKKRFNCIWRRRNGGELQGNGGFTLVELIVVLIVLGILVTLAVMGLRGWQDYADFKRNNEAAKSIFVAAQTQLTQYGERGQLTELIDAVTDGGKAEPETYLLRKKALKDKDGNTVILGGSGLNEGTIWESFTGKDYDNVGNIYYLMVDKGSYSDRYQALKGLSPKELNSSACTLQDRRIRALFDLIDPYVADKSMLDAAVCIEFDPDPKVAMVYSVFYNDKVKSFTYEEHSVSLPSDVASIQSRKESDRREKKTGYYGVDTMAKGTDTYISRPVVTEFKLNNKETLNLSWKALNGENHTVDDTALTTLLYTITLYDMSNAEDKTGKPLMQILLGSEDRKLDTGIATCAAYYVRGQNADGSYRYEKGEDVRFPVEHSLSNGTLTLVLDGLDLSADETTSDLSNTASIRRLSGLTAERISATIVGRRPGVYDTTTQKRSNTESAYFGNIQKRDDGTVVYMIDNMRHFNNIRYKEADEAAKALAGQLREYQISTDLNWKSTLLSGVVYESLTVRYPTTVELKEYYFKPILRLGKDAVLTSSDERKARTLGGFTLDIEYMQPVTAETDVPAAAIGLFVVNKGTMRNLILDNINVNGVPQDKENLQMTAKAAGGFCGRNEGVLKNLSVQGENIGNILSGTSEIHGVMNVGGIMGEAVNSSEDVVYENLVNRATVTGQLYVGGIAGRLELKNANITVAQCENYGKIRGAQERNDLGGAYFLGGIAGSAEYGVGYSAASGKSISIRDCKSSPYYTSEEIDGILTEIKNAESADTVLVGDYVGGIVGYNDSAEIEACSTTREQGTIQGYVVGRNYVGGIVGYNSGDAGLNSGTNNINQAYVIGNSYAGGIVGCNALGKVREAQDSENPGVSIYRAELTSKELAGINYAHIEGWVNEGVVSAAGDYVGGITGYNGETGVIENSYSNVDYNNNMQNVANVSSEARFAGGVAGYNKGKIINTATGAGGNNSAIAVVSVVNGKDYVGGIVGFNDKGGIIQNYGLQGGYISGNRFVGGFAGINLEESIFESHIMSNPNQISGDYFVGGIIGGNLVPTEKTTINADFKTDNFLGTLSAEHGAFAGGFIGYNYLLKNSVSGEDILKAVDAMIQSEADGRKIFAPLSGNEAGESVTEEMELIEAAVNNLLTASANTASSFVIRAVDDSTAVQEKMGGVTGKVYVSGIIGYNQASTKLEVRNVENITPVTATGYITRKEGLDTEEKNYSYAGGIIGKVEENVLLYNCRNKEVGTVRSSGTYTGGLAELNYGVMERCVVSSIGDNTMDYVGGLVGVNAAKKKNSGSGLIKGSIIDCVVSGQITGGSYVGGLAAENYGSIQYDASISADSGEERLVDASGIYAGGLVGYAYASSEITIKKESPLCISVQGTASGAGAVAGANAGTVSGYGGTGVILNAEGGQDDNTDDTGTSIRGNRHVGGFIGIQLKPEKDLTLRDFENRAHVQATSGYAGGILAIMEHAQLDGGDGELTDDIVKTDNSALIRLIDCSNYGLVEVLMDSEDDEDYELGMGEETAAALEDYPIAAGGITAINSGIIQSCGDYAEVRANGGVMGGIAGINFNIIRDSEAGTPVDKKSTAKTVELSGGTDAGGIAAVNQHGGLIEHSTVRNLILRNQSEYKSGNLGGIVGRNGIDEPQNGVREATIKDCSVGIFAELKNDEPTKANYAEWRKEAAEYVSVRYSLNQDTFQTGDSETIGNTVVLISNAADVNMGGVAGMNDGTVRGEHKDSYHTVVAADLRFFGNSLTYYGNIGGIVGWNGGTVRNYEFSGYVSGTANNPSDTPSYNAGYDLEQSGSRVYGYGGIVGRNGSDRLDSNTSASVESCYLGMAKIQGTGDTSNRTNVGGVAGFNGKGAAIKNITFSQAKTGGDDDAGLLGEDELFSYMENGAEYFGTVWVNVTKCGHTGGVAGYNHGEISGINWSDAYKLNRQEKWVIAENGERTYYGYFKDGVYTGEELASVDGTGAIITAGSGHVGGIVGYNRRTGSISQAVTGRNWLVYAAAQEQDNAIGGIMGYNISEQDLVSCDNHATVVKRLKDSNAVGGMAGRNENGTTSSWRFYDCHNYGKIIAAQRAGGMIGNWKYRGGTLEACMNFGRVESVQGMVDGPAGGLVGMIYQFTANEIINIVRCENHGTVKVATNSLVGGFIGKNNSLQKIQINIYDGINTGMIEGSGDAGGFIGSSERKDVLVNLQGCHNYGYSASGSFSGISWYANSNVSINECFGVTDIRRILYPITQTESINGNGYYFDEISDGQKPMFWVERAEAVGNEVRSPENINRIVREGTGDNMYFLSGNKGNLTFWFNCPVYLMKMDLEWASSDVRTYSYDVAYQTEGSSEWTTLGSIQDHYYDFGGENAITAIRFTDITAKNTANGSNTNAALAKLEVSGKITSDGSETNYTKLPQNAPASSYSSKGDKKGAVFTWDGPEITSDHGKSLFIRQSKEGNTAESLDGKVKVEVGDYTLSDIQNPERYTNSAASWKLCKGTAARTGLDELLKPIRSNQSELQKPTNLSSVPSGGDYLISWTGDSSADYYTVRCSYSTGDTKEYTVYTTSVLMSSALSGSGDAAGASVTVTAHRGTEWAMSDEYDVKFGKSLPYPQVRWELAEMGQYRVVLANVKEYEDFAAETGVELSDIQINTTNPQATINGNASAGTITFLVSDGGKKTADGSYQLYGSSKISNAVFTNYAAYKGSVSGIQESPKVLRESMYPTRANYETQGKAGNLGKIVLEKTAGSDDTVGFAGKTVNELEYRITMDKEGGNVVDFRSEVMAKDPVLGVPVALSVSRQTKISSTSTTAINVQLGDFPLDFLDYEEIEENGAKRKVYKYQDVMVRAYPTKMSNDIVYQGWEINQGTSHSANELRNLTVTENGRALSENEQGVPLIEISPDGSSRLRAGYVIERSGADNYTLYYNTLLRLLLENDGFADNSEWLNNSSASYMKYQIYYYRLNLENDLNNVQPKPVVFANAVYTASSGDSQEKKWQNGIYDNDGEIVLTWDQGAKTDKPAYSNAEGELPYAAGAEYILNLYGVTVNGNGEEKTTVLVNNYTYTTPSATETAFADYNGYKFDAAVVKTWDFTEIKGTLTRVGEVKNGNVTTKFPSTTEISLPMRRRLPQVQNVNISLQKENGLVLKDGLNYSITWNDLATGGAAIEEQNALDHYLVTIQSKTKPDKILQVKANAADSEANVDLRGTFDREERIRITVKAIAKADSNTYRDGPESTELEMQVPKWLVPPQMGKAESGVAEDNMTQVGDTQAKSVQEFLDECLLLHMEKENYTTNVKYQIAMELYDTKAAAEEGISPLEEAKAYLPAKGDNPPKQMTYDSTQGHTYSLSGLPIQYAGKYVRVMLRAQTDGNISSVWTDEQSEENMSEGEETVLPYKVFRLPNVQVDAVELNVQGREVKTYPVMVDGQELVDSGEPAIVYAEQYLAQFDMVEYADDYRITMIQSGQYADKKASPSDAEAIGYLVQDVNEMVLIKETDTKYVLEFQSTERNAQGEAIKEKVELTVDDDMKKLPYTEPVVLRERESDGKYAYVELNTYVGVSRTDSGGIRMSILLPDCKEIKETSESVDVLKENVNLTSQLLVQSIAAGSQGGAEESAADNYLDSDWAWAAWNGSELQTRANIRLDDEEHAVKEPTSGVDEQAVTEAVANRNTDRILNDVAYYLDGLQGGTYYLVSVYDTGGKQIGVYGVPYTATSSWGDIAQQIWFPVYDFAKYANETVTVRFRSIFNTNIGGISEWSKQSYRVKLPALPDWAVPPVMQKLSAARQYEVLINKTERSVLRRSATAQTHKIDAKQYQITWDYNLADTAVTGYDLTIHGENMNKDYELKLDMSRGWFGSIPGIKEYLTEEGKVLYGVSYSLDGDIITRLTGLSTATASNSDMAVASDSNTETASPSNAVSEPGSITLECRLQAEYRENEDGETVIRFTLTLPDVSFASLKGDLRNSYRDVFEDGLYQTETLRIAPVMVNRYYPVPESPWIYLDKWYEESEAEEEVPEENSEDGILENDLTKQ